jgi:hypothetical protein
VYEIKGHVARQALEESVGAAIGYNRHGLRFSFANRLSHLGEIG